MIGSGGERGLVGRLEVLEQCRFDVVVDQPQRLMARQSGGHDGEHRHQKGSGGIAAHDFVEPDAEAHWRRLGAFHGRANQVDVALLKKRALPDVVVGRPLEQHDGIRPLDRAFELLPRAMRVDEEHEPRSKKLQILLQVRWLLARISTGAQLVPRATSPRPGLPRYFVRLENPLQKRRARTVRVGVDDRGAEAAHVYSDDMRVARPEIVLKRQPIAAARGGCAKARTIELDGIESVRDQFWLDDINFRGHRHARGNFVVQRRFLWRPRCASRAPLPRRNRAHQSGEWFTGKSGDTVVRSEAECGERLWLRNDCR